MKSRFLIFCITYVSFWACSPGKENVQPAGTGETTQLDNIAPCPQRYFYKDGQKTFPHVIDTMVWLGFNNSTPSAKANVLAGFSFLKPVDTFIVNNLNMFFVRFKNQEDCHSIKAKIALMEQNPDVAFVSPVFGDASWSISDEFIVKLKATNQYPLLQQLAQANNCNINSQLNDLTYSLTVNKASSKDALDMANLFIETGNFDFAEPNSYYFK